MVGMAEASGCYTFKKAGDKVKKGELIGEFRLGGSSYCAIFNKECKLDFTCSLAKSYYYDEKEEGYSSNTILVRSPLAKVLDQENLSEETIK